jgi:uncharacterized protein YjbI with pentapeptide repeats
LHIFDPVDHEMVFGDHVYFFSTESSESFSIYSFSGLLLSESQCEYEGCDEMVYGVTLCIFHNKNYLDGDNYDKNKDEVATKFKTKLSNCPAGKPLNFKGYYLPDISFGGYKFSEPLDFGDATFTEAYFGNATFTEAYFGNATFTEAYFGNATFTKGNFVGATFTGKANFREDSFTEKANFHGVTFTKGADFRHVTFTKGADFSGATFTEEADFRRATFKEKADFYSATFTKGVDFIFATLQIADFSQAKFLNEVRFSGLAIIFKEGTLFRYTIFEQPYKALFDVSDLSKVSFAGSDISKVTFTDEVKWGGKDHLKIIEEELIETGRRETSLELVLYVYRRLRENYEFNLKFDEAGKFFIKEMELKRKYRTVIEKTEVGKKKFFISSRELRERREKELKRKYRTVIWKKKEGKGGSREVVKKNGWLRRNFSLTALYYHFSSYGESIVKPTIIGAITVGLSTLFWIMQSKPTLDPHFIIDSRLYGNTSHFIYLELVGNSTHLLSSFQRSLPVLSLPSDIKVGIIDYITKIVGGALTFGLLIIAFRRKFERKYTR